MFFRVPIFDFVLWSRLLDNTVPTTSAYLPINSQAFKSRSKMLCTQVFARRNICEKLPKAVSFTSVRITFNIIVRISADKASAHNCRTFSQSIHFPLPWSELIENPEEYFHHSLQIKPTIIILHLEKISPADLRNLSDAIISIQNNAETSSCARAIFQSRAVISKARDHRLMQKEVEKVDA